VNIYEYHNQEVIYKI